MANIWPGIHPLENERLKYASVMMIATNLLVKGQVVWLESEVDALTLGNRESVARVYTNSMATLWRVISGFHFPTAFRMCEKVILQESHGWDTKAIDYLS